MTAIGTEERQAVLRVLESGVLSGFLAGNLFGGPEVNALEDEWASYFGFKHAVAMNSATSCLIAACKAVGVSAGSTVITPALTMSATATAPLVFGADIKFVDIEPNYFCLDTSMVSRFLNRNNSAIITVDLFGQSSDPEIKKLEKVRKFNLPVIQDASQRPIPGGFGDIVVYSLNYHKHIHCGEGGVACTNDDELDKKLRLIRNHAENAEEKYFGFNFRMTEIEAAIARAQLKKLPLEIQRRQETAKTFSSLAPVRPGTQHAWYLFPHLTQVENSFKYSKPLYQLPLFFNRKFAEFTSNTEKVWKSVWLTKP